MILAALLRRATAWAPPALALALLAGGCGGQATAPPPEGDWISGRVTDEAGAPQAGIPVSAAPLDGATGGAAPLTALSGSDGRFRLGPLPARGRYHLRTSTDDHLFWDFACDTTLEAGMPLLRLALVRRWPLVAGCAGTYHERGGFLALLRDLTGTDAVWQLRPDHRLLKWASYPVPVHIAAPAPGSEIDLAAAAREAVDLWNSLLGEPCLAPVDTIPARGIRIVFAAGAYLGLSELIEPPRSGLNLAVPELVRVTISLDLRQHELAVGVVAHELAHALGLGGHSRCDRHLSWWATSSATVRAPAPEEVAALRACIHLPQGTPMDAYRPD